MSLPAPAQRLSIEPLLSLLLKFYGFNGSWLIWVPRSPLILPSTITTGVLSALLTTILSQAHQRHWDKLPLYLNKIAIYLNVFGELMTKGGYYAKDDDKFVIVFSIIASFCNPFSSEDQLANMFTKFHSTSHLRDLISKLNLVSSALPSVWGGNVSVSVITMMFICIGQNYDLNQGISIKLDSRHN